MNLSLFVGGPADGKKYYISSSSAIIRVPTYISPYEISGAATPKFEKFNYTRRTFYNNKRDKSFKVFAIETMSGYEVMLLLSTRKYRDNPLMKIVEAEKIEKEDNYGKWRDTANRYVASYADIHWVWNNMLNTPASAWPSPSDIYSQ